MSAGQAGKYSFAVLTMSDKGSVGEREDTSGAYLVETLKVAGFTLAGYAVVPDVIDRIVAKSREFIDILKADLLITTGGTGLAPTDVTPEAMNRIIEKEIPGIVEMMRFASLQKTPRAALSRGRAGVCGKCLVINLPGSQKAVRENLEVVLPILDHALEKIKGDPSDCGANS